MDDVTELRQELNGEGLNNEIKKETQRGQSVSTAVCSDKRSAFSVEH